MARSIEEILKDVRIDEIPLKLPVMATLETSLEEAYKLLVESPHGALLVLEGGEVRGIFTERDVLYRTALEGHDGATPLSDLMTSDPVVVSTQERVADAIHRMTEKGYRHLPLVDGRNQCAGLLATRDVLRFIADHFPEAVLNLPPRLHQQMLRAEGG